MSKIAKIKSFWTELISFKDMTLSDKIFDITAYIVFCGFLFLCFNVFLCKVNVNGPSMENTFYDGEKAVASNIIYDISDVKRGDVVCAYVPLVSENVIKRVIGIPGDRVTIYDGKVYVNDVMLKEDYAVGQTDGFLDIIVDEDYYFLMGDNREVSMDSRMFGTVSGENIYGKVLFKMRIINFFSKLF